jgi:hypothetical protein
MNSANEIYQVKNRHSDRLRSLPGVSGVGVAKGKDGGLVIAIHVNRDDPNVTENLPKEIEGYPVEVVQSGPFSKL